MNPKLTKFLGKHPDITVLGFAWAGYWRLIVAYFVIWIGIMLLIGGADLIFG